LKTLFLKVIYKILKIFFKNYKSNYNNHKIYYKLDSTFGKQIFLKNYHESVELKKAKRFIKQNSIVIDIGAHVGLFSLIYSQYCKKGFVLSLEPNLDLFDLIIKNIFLNNVKNIIPISLGADKKNEILKFNITKDPGYSSIIKNNRNIILKNKNIFVINLYTLLKNLKYKIDFIKIDTEGNEFSIVNSLHKIIKKHRPVFQIEIINNHEFNKFKLFFLKENYELQIIKNNKLIRKNLSKYKFNRKIYNHFFSCIKKK